MLAFLLVSGLAASTDFLLGVEYSQAVSQSAPVPGQVVIDSQRFIYAASGTSVTKYSAAGSPVWVASLGSSFFAWAIAVDLSGNVYAISAATISPNELLVAKVNADGRVSGPSVMLGTGLYAAALAVDGNGHLWVTGKTLPSFENPLQTTANAYQKTLPNITSSHVFVARLNSNATAVDYATYLSGSSDDMASGVAVDGSGSAFITGTTQSTDFPLTAPGDHGSGFAPFFTRLTPDGSGLVYSVLLGPGNGPGGGFTNPTITADASGDAAVSYVTLIGCTLSRFDQSGDLAFSKTGECAVPLVIGESAGNTYVSGTAAGNHPVKNSVAPCGTIYLDVYGPTGDLLQSTWLPSSGAILGQPLAMTTTTGLQSTVLLLTSAQVPTSHTGEYLFEGWLTTLSSGSSAQPLALACLADAAVYAAPGASLSTSGTTTGIAPGEIVSLFGQGLGPQQSVQPSVTLESGYPVQLADVQVLFNGQPAPLIYAQDAQINAIVPWELTAGSTTNVCVSYNGSVTNCLVEPVIQAAPAVFTIDGVHAAALNQDGTINSAAHPAPGGTTVSIFATGLGPISPAARDGAIVVPPLPANAFGVTAENDGPGLGGTLRTPFPVAYAGPAPYEVAGFSQINLQVPASFTTPITATPIFLHAGNTSAQFEIYTGSGF